MLSTTLSTDDLEILFTYELCSYPPALFDSHALPLEANKANLADALWTRTKKVNNSEHTGRVAHVLDGGSLLHRVPWHQSETCDHICSRYINYIQERYKDNSPVTIVFDGYSKGSNAKDVTHMRRSRALGPDVTFTGVMHCQLKKDEFLSNHRNKEKFIYFLGAHLEECNYSVMYAEADTDVLIVKTVVESSHHIDTVLVRDDTDLLVLLIHHFPSLHDVYFKPEVKQNATKDPKTWDIKKTQQALGENIRDNTLFIHAFLGCDCSE